MLKNLLSQFKFGKEKQETLKSISEVKTDFKSDDLVCYCFEFTRNDIEQDYIEQGQSTIMAKIATEKKIRGLRLCKEES